MQHLKEMVLNEGSSAGRGLLALVLGTVFLCWIGAAQAVDSRETYVERGTPPPMARLLEWHDAAGDLQVRALVISEWTERAALTRILVAPSGGERFVLDEVEEPLAGRTRQRITAEASGWWIEATEQTNLKLDDMADVGRPAAAAEKFMQENRTLQITVRASGPLSYRTPVQDWTPSAWNDLPAGLEAAGLASRSIDAMRPEVRRGIRSLGALRAAEPRDGSVERFDRLLDLLSAMLDAQQAPEDLRASKGLEARAAEWTMSLVAMELGTDLEASALEDFARSFPGLDPEAPLRQLRTSLDD